MKKSEIISNYTEFTKLVDEEALAMGQLYRTATIKEIIVDKFIASLFGVLFKNLIAKEKVNM